MDTKFFLQGFNSKKSVNTSNGSNISLKGKRRLLPTNDVAEVISQYDLYVEEREKCNKIRLTCQVNPICTNVLFNRISEIVKDEGDSSVTYVNYGVYGGNTDDKKLADEIKYKKKEMSFWSGNTMNYQSVDKTIPNKSKSEKISIVRKDTNHNTDGTLESNVEHPTNSIRDMQLSNYGYVYHCGLDVFNNHLIRSNTFKTVCKCPNNDMGDYTAFNTIADLMRDVKGNKVVEKLPFPVTAGVPDHTKFIPMHLYEYDDIYTFNDCVKERMIDKYNGWVGFNNRPKIKSYDDFSKDEELSIERPIMSMNGGDFVDMYPDRTLYSFVPKYNSYRNRLEKNWNYCLTYPSSSTTEGFEDIIERNNNSLKAIYFNENTRADNGTKQLVIYSIAKHGLSVGDYVNVYNTTKDSSGNTTTEKIIDNAEVSAIVDDYIFTVFNADVQISQVWVELTPSELRKDSITLDGATYKIDKSTRKFYYSGTSLDEKYYIINDSLVNFDRDAQHLSYKKVVNDIECEYYVRIFSKIPNFKNASADTSTEYSIYKNNGALINTYQGKEYDYESHVSRLAFAKNIYSDELGEIVFTDDIDLSNLKDNLGRPLSSIYLTFVKNNKGYKEWYGFDYNDWSVTSITESNVEFSHCFGKIKCGIETSDESIYDNNINSIYKINRDGQFPMGYDVDEINGERDYKDSNGKTIDISDNEVWFDLDKHYYGDLSYYDSYNAVERHIQPIMHRFNTAQRESIQSKSNNYYKTFVYDEITNDDYDKGDKYTITAYEWDGICNSKNEGYYYNPHYEIPIRTYDKLQTVLPDFLTMRSLVNEGNGARITTLQRHFLSIGDKSVLYDKAKNKYYYCTTVKGSSDNDRVFTCRIYDENGDEFLMKDLFQGYSPSSEEYDSDYDIANFRLFKIDNLNVPSYARILKDGTCRIIWRNLLNNGLNKSDDSIEEYPFTNGAFYINKKIDIYVRRQDPYNLYGLYSEEDIEGNTTEIENEDNYAKEEEITC